MNAEQLKRLLGLEPLAIEGGYFTQTYRSDIALPASALPESYGGASHSSPSRRTRAISTAIYFLLTADTFSSMHRLAGDEIYHFYLGDPVEMLVLEPDGRGRLVRLGQDLEAGMRVQTVVAGGTWQGSRLAAGGQFALMGTTMAPGFEARDFEAGDGEALCAQYPEFGELIRRLTRE